MARFASLCQGPNFLFIQKRKASGRAARANTEKGETLTTSSWPVQLST